MKTKIIHVLTIINVFGNYKKPDRILNNNPLNVKWPVP
jgi:hypothetical protein